MKSVKVLVLAGALLASSAVFARTEPNSFLNRPANTVAALVGQARNDAQVMSRFRRHFGWTREEVLSFLGTLKPGALKQDGVYLVYNVNDNEEINAKVIFYKKGTRVWENAAGEPIMKVSCANPMVRGTDDRLTEPPLVVTSEDSLRPVSAVMEGAADGDVVSALVPVEPSLEAQVAPGVLMAGLSSVPVAAGAAFNPLTLAPLAGLGLIRTGGSDDPGENPPPPVPEPATMALIAAGGAAIALRKKAKKG